MPHAREPARVAGRNGKDAALACGHGSMEIPSPGVGRRHRCSSFWHERVQLRREPVGGARGTEALGSARSGPCARRLVFRRSHCAVVGLPRFARVCLRDWTLCPAAGHPSQVTRHRSEAVLVPVAVVLLVPGAFLIVWASWKTRCLAESETFRDLCRSHQDTSAATARIGPSNSGVVTASRNRAATLPCRSRMSVVGGDCGASSRNLSRSNPSWSYSDP